MRTDLEHTQHRFTAHLRDPLNAACPADVPARRMQAYRELLTNNVESAISACFPVLKELVGEPRWRHLTEQFFATHRAHTPIYREIPAEFRAWLAATPLIDLKQEFPYLLELAHYEWMELALDIEPTEIPETGADPHGDLLAGIPVLNPLARMLTYGYPVHRIGPDFRPKDPDTVPNRLIMVRQRDHGIGFLEINPLVARLFEALRENHTDSGQALLNRLHVEFPAIPSAAFQAGGSVALQELATRDIILGTRIPDGSTTRHGAYP
ncbi:MAG TPA: DUF2063 domain-containing protein [Gammaproteobacteria bacterium]|nr:DUF2063 domain-containing protein [Gammaproteobacteria bacterium]